MEILVALVVAIPAIVIIGKMFGHKHDWVFDQEHEIDSIYSKKIVNVYEVYTCKICGKPQVAVFERKKNG